MFRTSFSSLTCIRILQVRALFFLHSSVLLSLKCHSTHANSFRFCFFKCCSEMDGAPAAIAQAAVHSARDDPSRSGESTKIRWFQSVLIMLSYQEVSEGRTMTKAQCEAKIFKAYSDRVCFFLSFIQLISSRLMSHMFSSFEQINRVFAGNHLPNERWLAGLFDDLNINVTAVQRIR